VPKGERVPRNHDLRGNNDCDDGDRWNERRDDRRRNMDHEGQRDPGNQGVIVEIHRFSRGFAGSEKSNSTRNACMRIMNVGEVLTIGRPRKAPK
jgi:hypothetical protein